MSNQQSSELAEPGVGAFDNPPSVVSTQLPAVLVFPQFVVGSVGHDQSMPRLASRSRSGSES
jgi:hypothetical protein